MVFQRIMTRSGSWNGREWNSTELMTLNIAVLAPMPSASVITATAVKPGDLAQHAQSVADVLKNCVHVLHSYLSATMGSTLAARRAGR